MDYLKTLSELLPRITLAQREELICQIHNAAGRLPYLQDEDQGAVLLEQIGDETDDEDLKRFCYKHAIFRARWCAQAATSGGEGLSRARHLDALQEKMKEDQE